MLYSNRYFTISLPLQNILHNFTNACLEAQSLTRRMSWQRNESHILLNVLLLLLLFLLPIPLFLLLLLLIYLLSTFPSPSHPPPPPPPPPPILIMRTAMQLECYYAFLCWGVRLQFNALILVKNRNASVVIERQNQRKSVCQ